MQRGVARRVAEEDAARVIVDDEAHDVRMSLLAAAHERRQTLHVRHRERCARCVQDLRVRLTCQCKRSAGTHLRNVEKTLTAGVVDRRVTLLVL